MPTPAAPGQPYLPQQANQPQQGYPNPNYYAQSPPSGFNFKKILVPVGVLLAVVAIAVIALVASKQFITPSLSLENYSNDEFGFEIQKPEGWEPEVRNENFAKSVSFTEPGADLDDESEAAKYRARIEINYDADDSQLLSEAEFFDTFKEGIRQTVDRQSENPDDDERISVESEEMTTVGDHKAYKLKAKISNFDGRKDANGHGIIMVVYAEKSGYYTIAVSAHESEAVVAKMDTIIESFKIK